MKIQQIDKEIDECVICGKYPKPHCSHTKEGKVNILLVGESPAKNGWLVSSKAFYDVNGKLQSTGKILQSLLDLCGLSIDDIYFTECCKCHISDRKILKQCSTNCYRFLLKQLEVLSVDIILTMGVFASQVLLNEKIEKFSNVVGKEFKFKLKEKEFKVIPIYHCSPINPLSYKGNKEVFIKLNKYVKK